MRGHAVAGGILAALGFLAMQRLFGLYVANFPAYTVMYGAFAAVPIFLSWLYLSWSVILVGALVVAELPQATRQ
jgi:membrane protein